MARGFLQLSRRIYDLGLSAVWKPFVPRGHRATFILGSGRSGTTAYLEALVAGLGAQPVFEPLMPGMSPAVNRIVPSHGYMRVPVGSDDPEMFRLMSEILAGRHLSRWSLQKRSPLDIRRASHLVVKEVRANRMAGWLHQSFPEVPMRIIVRHPVPVVSSMLDAEWMGLDWSKIVPPAAAALGVPAADLAQEDSPKSRWLTALWIADTAALLREVHPPVLSDAIHYEDLVRDPASVLEVECRVFQGFNATAAMDSLKIPSAYASASFKLRRRNAIPLPSRQLRDMEAMLRAFDITLYNVWDPEPERRLTRR